MMGEKHHRHVWYDHGLGISMSTPWYDGSSKQSGEGQAAVSLRVLSVYILLVIWCYVMFYFVCIILIRVRIYVIIVLMKQWLNSRKIVDSKWPIYNVHVVVMRYNWKSAGWIVK